MSGHAFTIFKNHKCYYITTIIKSYLHSTHQRQYESRNLMITGTLSKKLLLQKNDGKQGINLSLCSQNTKENPSFLKKNHKRKKWD